MSEDEEEKQDKKLIQKEFLERLAEEFISDNVVNEEFGVPIRKNVVVTGGKEDEEEHITFVAYPEIIEKPTPVIIDNKKYCRWCYDKDIQTPLTHKSFLCKNHYKDYRNEKEKLRLRAKRKEKKQVGIEEYKMKVGTSDFSFEMCKKADGTPDWEKEADVVHNELERIKNCNTIGDIAYKRRGYWEKDKDIEEEDNYQNDW